MLQLAASLDQPLRIRFWPFQLITAQHDGETVLQSRLGDPHADDIALFVGDDRQRIAFLLQLLQDFLRSCESLYIRIVLFHIKLPIDTDRFFHLCLFAEISPKAHRQGRAEEIIKIVLCQRHLRAQDLHRMTEGRIHQRTGIDQRAVQIKEDGRLFLAKWPEAGKQTIPQAQDAADTDDDEHQGDQLCHPQISGHQGIRPHRFDPEANDAIPGKVRPGEIAALSSSIPLIDKGDQHEPQQIGHALIKERRLAIGTVDEHALFDEVRPPVIIRRGNDAAKRLLIDEVAPAPHCLCDEHVGKDGIHDTQAVDLAAVEIPGPESDAGDQTAMDGQTAFPDVEDADRETNSNPAVL